MKTIVGIATVSFLLVIAFIIACSPARSAPAIPEPVVTGTQTYYMGEMKVQLLPQPQQVINTVAAHLEKNLRWPVPALIGIPNDNISPNPMVRARYLGDGTFYMQSRFFPDLINGSPDALYIVVHEELHDITKKSCWGPQDEAIVDAKTLDVWPSVSKRILGWVYTPMRSSYYSIPDSIDVKDVQYASVKATGSKKINDRAARVWRDQLWKADCPTRAAMIGPAY